MPIVPNYMNQVNAQNWSEGLGSVVQALNNPQAFANAELLRAHKDYYGAQTEKTLASILHDQQLNSAKIGTEGAQASYYTAGAGEKDAATAQIKQQTRALANMEQGLLDAGVDSNTAHLGGLLFEAGGKNSTTENNADALIKLFRPDVKLAPGETAVLTSGGPIPSPLLPPQGQTAQTVQPSGLGTTLNRGAQVNGNMITAPGKNSAVIGTNPYAPSPALDSIAERSAIAAHLKENPAQKAAQLTQSLDAMEQLISGKDAPYQGPLGSALGAINILNPRAQQFNQMSKVAAAASRTEPGAVSNYEQQLFQSRVPNLSNSREANLAISALGKAAAKKTQEMESFVQRFMSQGGSLAQAERIQAEYELDPRSRAVVELPDGGVTLKPNVNIFDWYQDKLNNPGTALGSPNSSPLANAVSGTTSTDLTPDEQAELAALRAKHKR